MDLDESIKMQVNAKSRLNVHSAAASSASKVKALMDGAVVDVYEQGHGWSCIGESQWVSSMYLIPYHECKQKAVNDSSAPLAYPQLASEIGYTEALHKQLTQDEGSQLECYRCTANKATIGIGHNLESNGLPVNADAIWQANPVQKRAFDEGDKNCWQGLVITAQQEQGFLKYDIQQFENQLQHNLTWYADLPANPRCSLTNMCFNLGWNGLSQFVNMFAALEEGQYVEAANAALESRWAIEVGDRSYRVAEQMRTPG